MRTTKRWKALVAGSCFMLAGACSTLDAPNQNNATLQDLTGGANRATVAAAAQGLLSGMRASGPCTGNCAYLGREGYNLDPSNPQNVNTLYINGGDFAAWATPYANDKLANIVITALTSVSGMTDAEKNGIRGVAKTVKAIDLMYVIQTTDVTGAVLDVPENATDPIPALATKAQVYTKILALLDEAYADLGNAGTAFAMTFPAGFAGFTTPAAFRQFNRAIRARNNVYVGNYAAALTDLAASFITPATVGGAVTAAQLNNGVYHTYSTTSGDATNGIFDPTFRQRYAHMGYAVDAQRQVDGVTRDDRFVRKFDSMPSVISRYGFNNLQFAFKLYPSLSAPVGVIRNEELILLRAEANLACTGTAPAPSCTTNATARAAALADINAIRVGSGRLVALAAEPAPLPAAQSSGDGLLDELLYNRRYSLVWEGGYRWLDARKYGMLAQLPKDQAGHVVFGRARLPDNECNARGIPITAAGGAGSTCGLPAGS